VPHDPGQVRDLRGGVEVAVGVHGRAPVAVAQLLDPGHGPFVDRPADGVLHPPAALAVLGRGVQRGEVVDDVVGGTRAVDG
jgi:hypothetical protein